MKIFTREEIVRVKEQFIRHQYEQEVGRIDDVNFDYFVLPKSINEDLPNFVLRVTGKSFEDGEVYGISEAVKPVFRKYMVFHEVVEFRLLPKTESNRCRLALEAELEVVLKEPKEFKTEYAEMRRRFFEDLINYGKKCGEYYAENDVNQWVCNVKRLDELLREGTN